MMFRFVPSLSMMSTRALVLARVMSNEESVRSKLTEKDSVPSNTLSSRMVILAHLGTSLSSGLKVMFWRNEM